MRLHSLRVLLGISALAAGAIAVSPLAISHAADGVQGDVSVQYQFQTAFTGTEKAGGRIIVAVTNHSPRALTNVTLRLADPNMGRITGPVQEDIALAAGETRKLEGEFVLKTELLESARPLEWIVVYTDAEGFAKQTLVRGETPSRPSIDADLPTTAAH